MSKNKELFESNYASFTLQAQDQVFLRDLKAAVNVAVLAEDWCGDVIRYVPVFTRMAEAAGNWNVRVFYRDQNPDLADHCLKDGKFRAIPVFLFFDADMNERACFTEKPAPVYDAEAEARAAFAREHPDLPDAALQVDEMSETTRNLYVTFIRQFRADSQPRWQQLFVEDIIARLQEARF